VIPVSFLKPINGDINNFSQVVKGIYGETLRKARDLGEWTKGLLMLGTKSSRFPVKRYFLLSKRIRILGMQISVFCTQTYV
jgi:hypothetical protein